MPADPKIVSFYITDLSSNSKVSTLKRRLASISVVHKLKGYYIDIKHPLIIENLMGIQRKKGVFQKSKNPILINELKEIINNINKSEKNESKKARDKALKLKDEQIAFATSSHHAEPVHLDMVKSWLAELELEEEDLMLGSAWPLSQKRKDYIVRQEGRKSRIYHNCSGKHCNPNRNFKISLYSCF